MLTKVGVGNEELKQAVLDLVHKRIGTRAEYEFWDNQVEFMVDGGKVTAVATLQMKESEYKNGRK